MKTMLRYLTGSLGLGLFIGGIICVATPPSDNFANQDIALLAYIILIIGGAIIMAIAAKE